MAEEKNQPDVEQFKKENKIVVPDSMKHGHNANEARLTPEQSLAVAEKLSQQMQGLSKTLLQAQPLNNWFEQQQKAATAFLDQLGAVLLPLFDAVKNVQFSESFLETLNTASKELADMEGRLTFYEFLALVPYLGLKMHENGIDAADFTLDDLIEANAYTIDNTRDLEERLRPIADLIPAAREESDKLNESVWAILAEMKEKDYPEAFRKYIAPKLESDPDFKIDLSDVFLSSTDENGNLIENSFFLELIEKSRAAYKKEHTDAVVNYKNPAAEKMEYPIDKINSNVWRYLEGADANGQLTFAVEKHGSKKPLDITYSINFDELAKIPELKITKQLSHFDKRVYLAVSALYNQGYEIVTISQIYATMGNTGRPNARDIQKINDSLTKMESAQISLDNIDEHEEYSNYAHFKYQGHLLLIERVSAVVNGQLSESAIHIFREPPLVTFAKQRGQITTFSSKLLEIPLNQTEQNLQLEDYLFERIAVMKNRKKNCQHKILYTSVFEQTESTTSKQKSRTIPKINTVLTSFKEKGYIKTFKETPTGDGVIISC